MAYETRAIPQPFIWRRLHSLAGLWMTVYLFQHLLINSQAALIVGEDGLGFIRSVNSIHELPYLPIIELAVLGLPFLIHGLLGVRYALTSQVNSFSLDYRSPDLPYGRNKAYTWQRITSWLLVFAILAHVVHMRFLEYPTQAQKGVDRFYMVKVDNDSGLETLAERLDVKLYNQESIQTLKNEFEAKKSLDSAKPLEAQAFRQEKGFLKALEARPVNKNQMIAVSKNFGTAELFMVRETFKMPLMMGLYTIFVLAACFHGFNGLWTFLIKWGVTLTKRSQRWMLGLSTVLMFLTAFLGLAAIYGTFWINLRQ